MKTLLFTVAVVWVRSLLIGCLDPDDLCVEFFNPVDTSLKEVHLKHKKTWLEIRKACSLTFPGHGLLRKYRNFTKEEAKLCGRRLVPFGITGQSWTPDEYNYNFVQTDSLRSEKVTDSEWAALGTIVGEGYMDFGYFNMTSRTLISGGFKSHRSKCGVCQISKTNELQYRFQPTMDTWYIVVYNVALCVVSKQAWVNDTVIDKYEKMQKVWDELTQLDGMSQFELRVELIDSRVNSEGYEVFNVTLGIYRYKYNIFVYGNFNFRFIVGAAPFVLPSFQSVTMVADLGLCLTTGDRFGNPPVVEAYTSTFYSGLNYMAFNATTYEVTVRMCKYNKTSFRSEWSKQELEFTPSWGLCSGNNNSLSSIQTLFLAYAKKVRKYVNLKISEKSLKSLIGDLPTFGYQVEKPQKIGPKANFIWRYLFTYGVYGNLETILSRYTHDVAVVDLKKGDFINDMFFITNLNMKPRVRGVYKNNVGERFDLITSDSSLPDNISSVFIAVSVSDQLLERFDLMAVLNYNLSTTEDTGEYAKFDDEISSTENRIIQLFAISLFENSNETSMYVDAPSHYVDFIFSVYQLPDNFSELFAAWDFETNSWNTDNCKLQKTTFFNNIVYRCKHLSAKENMVHGYYIMYNSFAHNSDILSLSKTLITILAVEVVFSSIGVISIFLTAILFQQWRNDMGHQIMLQMTTALLLNLILGFSCSLYRLDIMTIPCVVIGALRHYSFLAMFLWMLALSYLQYRRLTTVAGATTTTHLLLKVSLFAWGLPLIPVTSLLAWDYKRFYMTRSVDRGYCYPDGMALIVTVTAPAILVLVLNSLCFLYILNNIYKCVGQGKRIQRFGLSEKKAQLRNLGTSIFVFFLFGFSWLFNILSETEVIKNQTFFDYLFLVTATFHVSMLALFFVFFEEKTRGYWMELFRKVAGVKVKQLSPAPMTASSVAVIVARKRAEVRARVARNDARAAARAKRDIPVVHAEENVTINRAHDDTVTSLDEAALQADN